jgi:hypothetical protein
MPSLKKDPRAFGAVCTEGRTAATADVPALGVRAASFESRGFGVRRSTR